jgi:hypothetical protein
VFRNQMFFAPAGRQVSTKKNDFLVGAPAIVGVRSELTRTWFAGPARQESLFSATHELAKPDGKSLSQSIRNFDSYAHLAQFD